MLISVEKIWKERSPHCRKQDLCQNKPTINYQTHRLKLIPTHFLKEHNLDLESINEIKSVWCEFFQLLFQTIMLTTISIIGSGPAIRSFRSTEYCYSIGI